MLCFFLFSIAKTSILGQIFHLGNIKLPFRKMGVYKEQGFENFSEKGCLQGTTGNFLKNKVQRSKIGCTL